EAARVRGERKLYVIVFEILPTMTSLIVASFLGAAVYAVLFAAGLQFIGLGDPSSQSWGTMLYWAENNEALGAGMVYWAIMPGVCVALLGAAFALLNYAFDEISNPALKLRRLERKGAERLKRQEAPVEVPANPDKILEVRDLSVAYASDEGPVVAVDRVSFDLAPGEFLGIVGESGCGKSTLLYAIARLLGRDAERDERAQSGADGRRADARRVRGALEHVPPGDRPALEGGAEARLDRPGAPEQLPAPALGRDAPAGDDRDGAPVHARARDHGRADLRARRRRPALADGAD